jgi:hypothetical protein
MGCSTRARKRHPSTGGAPCQASGGHYGWPSTARQAWLPRPVSTAAAACAGSNYWWPSAAVVGKTKTIKDTRCKQSWRIPCYKLSSTNHYCCKHSPSSVIGQSMPSIRCSSPALSSTSSSSLATVSTKRCGKPVGCWVAPNALPGVQTARPAPEAEAGEQ